MAAAQACQALAASNAAPTLLSPVLAMLRSEVAESQLAGLVALQGLVLNEGSLVQSRHHLQRCWQLLKRGGPEVHDAAGKVLTAVVMQPRAAQALATLPAMLRELGVMVMEGDVEAGRPMDLANDLVVRLARSPSGIKILMQAGVINGLNDMLQVPNPAHTSPSACAPHSPPGCRVMLGWGMGQE